MKAIVAISVLLSLCLVFKIGYSLTFKIRPLWKYPRCWLLPALVLPINMWFITVTFLGFFSNKDASLDIYHLLADNEPMTYLYIGAGLAVFLIPMTYYICRMYDYQVYEMWDMQWRFKTTVFFVPLVICSVVIAAKYGPPVMWAFAGVSILSLCLSIWVAIAKPSEMRRRTSPLRRFGAMAGGMNSVTSFSSIGGGLNFQTSDLNGMGNMGDAVDSAPTSEWKSPIFAIVSYTCLALYYLMFLSALIVFTVEFIKYSQMPTPVPNVPSVSFIGEASVLISNINPSDLIIGIRL